jgi:6-phosphogluconolactonase
MYGILAKALREEIDWKRVQVFWGDERCVPPDHAESNYRMAHEALLRHVPIPAENVYRMRGEDEPQEAAAAYHALLKGLAAPEEILAFDLILLGIGEDGHTGSLFPGTDAITENKKWVAENFVPKLNTWRITLTYPVINDAREALFIVSGSSKASVVKRILEEGERLPAQLVQPKNGELVWFLDQPAANSLSQDTLSRLSF